MKIRKYMTEAFAKTLKPGDKLRVGYDDFNKRQSSIEVVDGSFKPDPFGGDDRYELVVKDDKRDFFWVMYAYAGPHRDGTAAKIMCSGSGAERIFIL